MITETWIIFCLKTNIEYRIGHDCAYSSHFSARALLLQRKKLEFNLAAWQIITGNIFLLSKTMKKNPNLDCLLCNTVLVALEDIVSIIFSHFDALRLVLCPVESETIVARACGRHPTLQY